MTVKQLWHRIVGCAHPFEMQHWETTGPISIAMHCRRCGRVFR